MYERVLVATDGSRISEQAIEYAVHLAGMTGASLDVLHVVDSRIEELAGSDGAESILEDAEAAGRRTLDRLVERTPELDVHEEIRFGVPYEEILAYADERDVELAVVGTGGAASSRLGSTAERVVTLADVPVLAVPGGETVAEAASLAVDDVVVPLDGSDNAERAAEVALEFAERVGATVHALYVVDTTAYDLEDAPRSIVGLLREGGENAIGAFRQQAESMGVRSTGTVARGRPADEILAYADGVDADLLVMGTRGRSGLPEHLLGSTTRRVVRDGTRPLLSIG